MKHYLSLVKVLIKENFSLRRLFGFDIKKEKFKALLIGGAILYSFIVLYGLLGYLFIDLGEIFHALDSIELLLVFLASYAMFFGFFIAMIRANGLIFLYEDYTIIGPLPLSPKTRLMAKMTVMLLLIYTMIFLFSLPVLFAYFYWQGFSIIRLLISIIMLVFIPLLPVLLGSFFSLFIAKITARFKYKQLLNMVLMIVIMSSFIILSFNINEPTDNPLLSQQSFMENIMTYYLPLLWFQEAIHQSLILPLLGVIVLNLLPLVLFLVLSYTMVEKINQNGLGKAIRKSTKAYQSRSKSTIQTLVHKEFKRFLSSPIYVMNLAVGPLFLVIIPVVSLFYKDVFDTVMGAVGEDTTSIEIGVLIFIGFSLSMVYSAAISLSLEGKQFWIVKSLPISANDLMSSKILFNVLLSLPFGIFALIILSYSFGLGFIFLVLVLLLMTVFTVMKSTVDAFINLFVPKFDFKNDVEVIKQSAGALLGVFGGFLFMALQGFIIYLLQDYLHFYLTLCVLILFNIILIALLKTLLKNHVEALLARLNA